ncbi:7178_t:CDS:2 [Ambispora leptoticha]|uniref:7178_t:CDS:1 n=1 Tax=Ambispora leptoticha TaxID=144679 RepID=A0A9N8VLF6_9GLOM|nr:7178_t:CDS:2 [Ambispora leptoticha]
MDAPTPTYTFDNRGVPTDPQVLKVYNGLSRTQRTTYNTLDDQAKSAFLYGIAEEKKKPRHYLNLLYAVINLLSVIGFNIWSHYQRRDSLKDFIKCYNLEQDFTKCWSNYKPEQDVILYQLCILFGTHIGMVFITAIIEGLFNKFQVLFIIVPIITGIGLAIAGGLIWTLASTAISFVEVGILFAESAMYYFSVYHR